MTWENRSECLARGLESIFDTSSSIPPMSIGFVLDDFNLDLFKIGARSDIKPYFLFFEVLSLLHSWIICRGLFLTSVLRCNDTAQESTSPNLSLQLLITCLFYSSCFNKSSIVIFIYCISLKYSSFYNLSWEFLFFSILSFNFKSSIFF